MNTLLWVVFPYVCLAIFVVGHWWRYKYDKFGWTTRSSQLYEDTLLKWGSPLFHFGMLGVVGGHIIGLLLPKGWTDAIGISESTYHAFALGGGLIAGAMALVGLVMLVYRRRTVRSVFKATTPMDKVMYLFLGAVILLGCWNTFASVVLHSSEHFNYRTTVSPWFRGIFYGQPDAALMTGVPLGFQLHALLAFALSAGAGRAPRSPCSPSRSSRCGPSPGSCTSSPHRWATSRGPMSSIGAVTSAPAPARGTAPRSAAGSARAWTTPANE